MITPIAIHNGIKIYTDLHNDGIFIDAFDLNEMNGDEIRGWLNTALPLYRESQLRNMYCMACNRFDRQFLYDADIDIILNGNLFTSNEKGELIAYLEQGARIYEKPKKTTPPKDKSGYVYVVSLGKTVYYKIGHTNNINRRITEDISPKMPENLEIVHVIETQDRFTLENRLHKMFASKRKNGEWFELSQDDIDYIRSL